MAVAVTIIAAVAFHRYAVNNQIRIAYGMTELVAETIDADRTSEFIEQGYNADGYQETWNNIERIKRAYPDLEYLYVLRIEEDGCHVVFDMDDDSDTGWEPGEVTPIEKAFLPYKDKLLNGEEIEPITSNDQFGYLLTVYTPVYDSGGVCQCYVGADFSMAVFGKHVLHFMANVVIFLLIIVSVTFLLSWLYLEKGLFHSMDRIDRIAFHDHLTGLGNNAAYGIKQKRLNKKIAAGTADFAIIVVDVNFLKRVNDTYGHEKGNTYLKVNAEAIARVFGKDNVYRVGGDEFTVVLENEAVKDAERMLHAFKEIRSQTASDNDWELVRAAVGIAYYDQENDTDTETVFKRADAAMYQDKVDMKAERRD